MNRLLVTVDSLRYDHFQYMPETRDYLQTTHDAAFATSTATFGSFPAIVGGEYPDGSGLRSGTSVAPHLVGRRVAITTNHLLSARYGYDDGFDLFESPVGGGASLKDKGAVFLSRGTLPYKVAVWGWNRYQRARNLFGDVDKSFRPAPDVIDRFLDTVADEDEWFGWLHFMEPHHPYDPETVSVDRATAQRVSRRVLAGGGDADDWKLVRKLYRTEVEELDDHLATLWEAIPDDSRVVFCADHGELLGEDGQWGHPGEMRPELLRTPFGTRNAPELGEVVSLIDVPTILRGEEHGCGTLDRQVAYATYGEKTAAMTHEHIATAEGVSTLDGESAENPSLVRKRDRFEPSGVVKEDAVQEDLEALGYA